MEIIGKIYAILNKESGQSSKGTWEKQDIIIETLEQYPKKICISNWGNKVNYQNLSVGVKIRAMINIESREYNSKWYTDIKVWKFEIIDTEVSANQTIANKPADNRDLPEGDILPVDKLPF